ncbi:MAG: undecaprenyl-diphosphate phosphatase [Nanopusillaceae archaeon]
MDIYPIILGVIQGITEWLPISSKTQIMLSSLFLLKINLSIAYTFGLFMEIGTIFAAFIYFLPEIIDIFKDIKMLSYIIIAILVTGLVGAPLYFISKILLEGTYNLGLPMLILGIILIADGIYIYYSRNKIKMKERKDLRLRDILIIGIAQGLAALPGVSRSGMTISTMLLLNYDPKDAFSFSYILYIPAALGAFFLTILFSGKSLSVIYSSLSLSGLILAIVTSFIVGIFSIDLLLKFAKKEKIYIINYFLGAIAIIFSIISFLL